MDKLHFGEKKNVWFWIFIVLMVVLGIALPMMSRSAGNSGDEDGFQIPQGKNVVNYYATHGQDTTCMDFKNLKYYGASFDVVAEYINETFHIDNISQTRHTLNALCGWLTILMVGLLAALLGGWRAAVFAALLMFLSPRYLGHSFNNPKDVPFAAAVIMAIYGMALFFKQFPKVKWYTYVILILAIAFSISIRIGGLILFGYFGLFGLLCLIRFYAENKRELKLKSKQKIAFMDYFSFMPVLKMLGMGIGICVVGYFLGLLLWPYAMQSPIKHPIEAFNAMSTFDTSLRQVFEGQMIWSDLLPWYYTPKYILMTIPLAVIIGMVLFFVFCWRKREDRFWAFFVFFTFFFPVFWIVYTHANVYGGWRHAMFAYPPMVVAAGWGFEGIVKWIEGKLGVREASSATESGTTDAANRVSKKGLIVNIASVAVLLLLLVGPIRHVIANHPYEYVYFNELSGGVEKAFGNYELDYYYHSTREASEWIMANAEPKPDGSKIRVGTWHLASVAYFFRNDTTRFTPLFIRWYEKENSDWDYAIFTVTGMNPNYLKGKAFPPKNTVKTIDVDGVPIAIILKRENKLDLEAFKLKEANSLDSAAMLYRQVLQEDPDNFGALLNLGEIYIRMNKQDSAQMLLEHYLEVDPNAESASYMYSYSLINQNKINEALDMLHKMQKHNPKFVSAYTMAIQLYLQQKDFVSAKKEFMKVIEYDRVDDQVVNLWIQYSAMQNINQQQAIVNLYTSIAKSLDKRGKHKEAEQYRKAIGR